MKSKQLVKTIVLSIVALLLVAVMITANVLLDRYALFINRHLAGDNVSTGDGDNNTDALTFADEVVISAAEESMVLLANKDNYLPKADLTKVNLFGWGSTDAGLLLTGGGSGGTTITDTLADGTKRIKVDLTDAFTASNIEYNQTLTKAYEDFSTFDADYRSGGSTGANAVDSLKNPPESFYTNDLMQQAKAFSDTAVVVISRWGAENGGSGELKRIGSYTNGTYLELTAEEKAMFGKLQEYNFDVVVLLNLCNYIECGFVEDYSCVKACLYIGIPGQSGTTAIPRILKGEVNPSGRIADTIPYDFQTNNPVYVNATKNGDDIVYQEGIYFGYKWYETADAEGYFADVETKYGSGYNGVVQFPFGFGLSYTDFSWKADWKQVDKTLSADGKYTVNVTVTNTGSVAGKDVVQLYGRAPYTQGGIEKADRVLLDFAKTKLIEPGQSDTVTLTFSAYNLASYDAYDRNNNGFSGYELEAGSYDLYLCTDAHTMVDFLTANFASDVQYQNDPTTGNKVGNLFTGDTAYANCPTDGSTALNTKVDYLSRANKFANMPTAQAGRSNVGSTPDYRHDNYNDVDVSGISYGQDFGMYLLQVVKTEGEGENATKTTRRATKEELDGTQSLGEGESFEFNTELLKTLNDYNAPEWDAFLNQLTESEVKDLIGMGGFMTKEVYSVGKPRCTDKDGPAGFNNNVTNPGKSSPYTLFPSESLLGCSFSKNIAYNVGVAQGKIGSSLGINGWYGPGANLHRSAYDSRNYEYFSEDSVLSGKLAANVIVGAKENNVYCYMKHFCVSEAGQNPTNVNTWLTEQALRECYLRPFEIAVKEGNANAIMSAFNRVGAVLSGYNYAMLTGVLRNEWNFHGSVITDWFTGGGYMGNHTLGVLGGNDLWLCGSTAMAANINLSDNAVAYAARKSVKNILYTYVNTYVTATTVKVNAEAKSPLFVALWVVIDVVLAAGIVLCVTFAVLPYVKKKATATAEPQTDVTDQQNNE